MKKKNKKFICLIASLIVILSTPAMTVFADEPYFSVQPKGAVVDNWSEYTVTWDIEGDYSFVMLQIYDENVQIWNNLADVGSSYTLEWNKNKTELYRLAVYGIYDELYSDEFTVTWRPADDLTTAEIQPLDFGTFVKGKEPPAIPVSIKNTGSYPVRAPALELDDLGGTYFEIVQNKVPADIAPNETDDTTWSVKIKNDVPAGSYDETLYLRAGNFEDYVMGNLKANVMNPGDLTYEMTVSPLDFGSLEYGYSLPENKEIKVKATGTGDLTKVSLKALNPSLLLITEKYAETNIAAGTESDGVWFIRPVSGLEPGEYVWYFDISCAEIGNPVKAEAKFTVTVPPTVETDIIPTDTVGETITQSSVRSAADTKTTENHSGTETSKSGELPESGTSFSFAVGSIMIAGAVFVIALLTALICVIVKKSKRR